MGAIFNENSICVECFNTGIPLGVQNPGKWVSRLDSREVDPVASACYHGVDILCNFVLLLN